MEHLVAAGHSAHIVVTSEELPDDPIARARGNSLGDNVGRINRLSRSPLGEIPPAGRPGAEAYAIIDDLGLAGSWAALVASGTVVDVG